MDHANSFNAFADLYGAARPGYPEALYDDIAAVTGLAPGDPVLEVGCGAGQATEALAKRGYALTAIDPGPDLIRVARERLEGQGDVRFEVAPFETFAAEPGAYSLIAAAQAWHWVDPAVGYAKAAEALAPGGWLAVFGHVPMAPPEPFAAAFRPHIEAVLGPGAAEAPTPETWYLPDGPVAGLIAASGLFAPAVRRDYAWTMVHSPESLAATMGATSYFVALGPERLKALTDPLGREIQALGGRYPAPYQTHLYLARRL